MRLRKPCIHDRYDGHLGANYGPSCPGGEFLPVGVLVIEKVGGKWPKKARQKVASALSEAVGHERRNTMTVETFVGIGDFLLDNLASETDLNVERLREEKRSRGI